MNIETSSAIIVLLSINLPIILLIICYWAVKGKDNAITSSRKSNEKIRSNLQNGVCTLLPTSYDSYTYTSISGDKLTNENIAEILKFAKSHTEKNYNYRGYNDHDYFYSVSNVKVYRESRTAKITFSKEERYKTIVRYEQRNYVKYPVYSDTKFKYSETTKSIKLNADILEKLHYHHDELISNLSHQIIIHINDPKFVPSWFLKKHIQSWKYKDERDYKAAVKNNEAALKNMSDKIETFVISERKKLSSFEKPIKKLTRKYEKVKTKNNQKKLSKVKTQLDKYEKIRSDILDVIKALEEQAKKNEAVYNERNAKYGNIYNDTLTKLNTLYSAVTPLSAELPQTDDFIPLQDVQYAERTKIMGCYVIRNTQNSKCYVGQSKDIRRRLSQHFKGVVPNNPIFAEDYYTSPAEIRETLFEVKIIPLETKDELDKKEKELIEIYQSFELGYNKTSGNV